ncbi:class I SAM-dependent methyltransferase [Candidatus Peregrinibacteria bacterium]|nr:class I SAM-dependent methyltransferase [Candidatus Peregrinibacteria bacterium]
MKKTLEEKTLEKVKESYDSIAKGFDQTRRILWKEFALFLPYLKKGMTVLDAGCGNGRLFEYLQKRGIEYLGVDQCEELIEIAKKRYPETKFQVQKLQELNVSAETFDAIFCIAALHHLPSIKLRTRALERLRTALKKDGILILTVWNLRQKKYCGAWIRAGFSCLNNFGLKYSWNDLWIRWGKNKEKRYYHAFSPKELKKLFDPKLWNIRDFYFTRDGNKVEWKQSYNLCLVLSKC